MINKQNLWFITLFSLILVLGIYYTTLGDDSLSIENIVDDSKAVINIEESNALVALQVAEDEATLKEMENYENILLDAEATIEEKNDAYDNLQLIVEKKVKSEEIAKMIKDKFSLDCFIKVNNDQINITIAGDQHDSTLANNIIRAIQDMYDEQMYITVKFEG